jgi:hypothetical protein
VGEVVPADLLNEIKTKGSMQMDGASQGSVVIEMQWGSSRFLPAHNNGAKYKQYYKELGELLAGKPVAITEFVTGPNRRGSGIFDRFSKYEQTVPTAIASNVSYAAAGPSRLGAFEVHIMQGNWDPLRCCPARLEPGQTHAGPPVAYNGRIVCKACADRDAGEAPGGAPVSTGSGLQHTLLHSKLWTRRWPGLHGLLREIACAVIPPPPPMFIDFEILPLPRIEIQHLTPIPLASPEQMPPKKAYTPDPMIVLTKRLTELDCPAQRGWKVEASGDNMCRCGGGSHTLPLDGDDSSIAVIMAKLGFDKGAFLSYVSQSRGSWAGKSVNDFCKAYVEGTSAEAKAMKDKVAKQNADIDSKHASIQQKHQQLIQIKESLQAEQVKTCAEWNEAQMQAKEQVEQHFNRYCSLVSAKVEGCRSASPNAAESDAVLKDAHALHQRRKVAFQAWEAETACWHDVPDVWHMRPDLAAIDLPAKRAMEKELRKAWEEANSTINAAMKALPSDAPFKQKLNDSASAWKAAQQEFVQFARSMA